MDKRIHSPPLSPPPSLPSPSSGEPVNLAQYTDISILTGAVKLYLRDLPIPLVTFDAYSEIIKATGTYAGHVTFVWHSLLVMWPMHGSHVTNAWQSLVVTWLMQDIHW